LKHSTNCAGEGPATPAWEKAVRAVMSAMPIHMGIMCERCRKVHFVGMSRGIKPIPTAGMYALNCQFCSETREFRKEMMHPYRVREDVFRTGFAQEGEYEVIPITPKPRTGNEGRR
jgi:hypothetical protein